MKPAHWYCEVYRMNFYFCIGWPPTEFERYMKRAFGIEFDKRCGDGRTVYCQQRGGVIIVVWVWKRNDFPVLAHECLHAANMTLEQAGWRPSLQNDEPQTYLLTTLFREGMRART